MKRKVIAAGRVRVVVSEASGILPKRVDVHPIEGSAADRAHGVLVATTAGGVTALIEALIEARGEFLDLGAQ